MVQCKVMKQLELLEQRKFEDEDIQEDISFLMEKMNESVQDLSSYDEYVTEVRSGRLEWSPVHRSEKFWRENAAKLNDKNYELLRILITLLESTKEPLVLSVACFDLGEQLETGVQKELSFLSAILGEYVRHYQRGKHVLETLGGKTMVMALLSHDDPNVRCRMMAKELHSFIFTIARYEALLAVQKLMVHNWEYLGRWEQLFKLTFIFSTCDSPTRAMNYEMCIASKLS